jgi:hypothetical protein
MPSAAVPKHYSLFGLTRPCLLGLLLCCSPAAWSDPYDQAKRIHDRIAGVPPEPLVLEEMADLIRDNASPIDIARPALEHPDFYRVTLKNFATPWTNRDQSVFAPLNDYTATIIGAVRDEIDFRQILHADLVYTGTAASGAPAYGINNNNHYEYLEAQAVDLSNPALFSASSQSSLVPGLPSDAAAGVMTTRASAQAFFYLGTNRAMLRFTLLNHLCHDLEELQDETRPVDRIRRDVSRSPGGDSRVFLNNCVACHAGMDPLAQAFAYYDFLHDLDADPEGVLGQIHYNAFGQDDPRIPGRVTPKHHNNANTFPDGFVIEDDQWVNYWRQGANAHLGWDSSLPGHGAGASSLGEELAHSQAFAQCQATKVFRSQCLRDPANADDRDQVEAMTAMLYSNGFNLKPLFAESAYFCAVQ